MGLGNRYIETGPCSNDVSKLAEQVVDALNDIGDAGVGGLTAGCGIDITDGTVSAAVDGVTIICSGGVLSATAEAGAYLAGDALELDASTFNVLVDGVTIQVNGSNQLEVIGAITEYDAGDALELDMGTFNVLVDGVTIGVNGSNQLELISAGAIGLAAGDGIVLSGSDPVEIAVDLATTPALEFTGGDLRVKVDDVGGLERSSDGIKEKWPYRVIKGQATDDYHPSSGTVSIDNVTSIHGETPVSGAGDVIECQTQEEIWLNDGDTVYAIYSEDSGAGPSQYWSVCTALNLESLLKGFPDLDEDDDGDLSDHDRVLGWDKDTQTVRWIDRVVGWIIKGQATSTAGGTVAEFAIDNIEAVSGVLPSEETITVQHTPRWTFGNDDVVYARYDTSEDGWTLADVGNVQDSLIMGTATDDVASDDSSFTITFSKLLGGQHPGANTITVNNTFEWEIDSGGYVVAARGKTSQTYEAIQAQCPG